MIGIIGAMEVEIEQLRSELINEKTHHVHGFDFYLGNLLGEEVVIVQCGIGKVNAAISTTLLIEKFQVSYLINTGVAGALDPALRVGDIVLADALSYHDVDVTGFGYEYGQLPDMPANFYSDSILLRALQNAARVAGVEPVIGRIVSGDQFVESQQRIEAIKEHYPRARAVEMESAAIAQTAHRMGVPFAIVRSISDGANDDAVSTYDEFVQEAGLMSANIIRHLIMGFG